MPNDALLEEGQNVIDDEKIIPLENEGNEENEDIEGEGEFPVAFLFDQNVIGISEMTIAEKYLIVSAFHPIANTNNFSLAELELELKKLDFLTFDWGLIPKPVFKDIFSRFSYVRLVYFCAHFRLNIRKLGKDHAEDMIELLCNHFFHQ